MQMSLLYIDPKWNCRAFKHAYSASQDNTRLFLEGACSNYIPMNLYSYEFPLPI
jgi:hypothetical protein